MNSSKNINISSNEDNDLDIKVLIEFFLRNKIQVGFLTFIGALLGLIIGFSLERIWEGKFQIVVANKSQGNQTINSLLQQNPTFSAFIQDKGNTMKTEVEILQSPSILMPVFDFIKIKRNKNFKYETFIKQLKVSLKRNTSVINISYQDKDKELILPTLEKIAFAYQTYSKRDRKNSIDNSLDFLSNQINIYKQKSSDSFKKAQNFALNNELIFPNLNIKTNNRSKDGGNVLLNLGISSETLRTEAILENKFINERIKTLEEIEEKESNLIFGLLEESEINNEVFGNLLKELKNIDSRILELQTVFQPGDLFLKRLKDKRNILKKEITKSYKNILIAKLKTNMALIKSLERPQSVLIKFQELIKEASYDETAKNNLLAQYQFYALESAKAQEPWELITNPTLIDDPVAPYRSLILIYGISGGFFIGSVFMFLKEKSSGIIHNEMKIKFIPKVEKIKQFNLRNINNLENTIKILINQSLDIEFKKQIDLIQIGDISQNFLDLINKKIKKINEEYNKTIINIKNKDNIDYSQNNNKNILILILQKNIVEYKDIDEFNDDLKLTKLDILGYIVLENNNNFDIKNVIP